MGLSNLDEFDKLLLETIRDVMSECLGHDNARIILEYLEKRGCPISDIPRRLDLFSTELRMLLGQGRGQILGSGAILEETIAEVLCRRIGVTADIPVPIRFADFMKKLQNLYFLAKRVQQASPEHAAKEEPHRTCHDQPLTHLQGERR